MLKKEDMDNDRDGKMKFCLGADTLETPLKPNGLCLPDQPLNLQPTFFPKSLVSFQKRVK